MSSIKASKVLNTGTAVSERFQLNQNIQSHHQWASEMVALGTIEQG